MYGSRFRDGGGQIWGVAEFSLQSPDLPWVHRTVRALGHEDTRHEDTTSDPACLLSSGSGFGLAAGASFSRFSRIGLKITGDVRLDNRRDLLGVLDLDPRDPAHADNRALILAAYEKWGTGCAGFLLGDFAFAVWDGRLKRLFCCRDHMGIRYFYYWRDKTRFVFASDSLAILSVPGIPHQLNRRKFAASTLYNGTQFYPEETYHAGILSLPAGAWLTVDANGIRQQIYWQPQIRPELVPPREDEAFEALRGLLFDAVECRIGGANPPVVAAQLSGGLDSSAVVGIAARCLEKSNRTILALAAVVPEERRAQIADEREFVDEFRSWPNVRIEYVTAPDRGPFDSIEEPCLFAVSPIRTSRFYLYEAFEDAAVSNGLDTVLVGSGGEWGATHWGHRYYVELAVRLRWITLAKEMIRMKRKRDVSRLHYLAAQFRSMLPGPNPEFHPGILLARDFPRPAESSKPWKCYSPDHRRAQAASIEFWQRLHAIPREQTVRGRVRHSWPLLDKRVLEFCLAAPGSMKVRNGYQRYLVRGALDGVLPARIRWRSDKVPFSPDYHLRYTGQLGKAKAFVAAIGGNDPIRSVIDVEKLGILLRRVDSAADPVALETVPGTIYAICFLRQFAEFRA